MKIRNKIKNIFRGKIENKSSNLFLILALGWFLIRVLPKPSRATYPCQKATINLLYIKVGLMLTAFSKPFKSITNALFKKNSMKILFISIIFLVLMFAEQISLGYYQFRYALISGYASASSNVYTYGTELPDPHRVVRVHADNATDWNFNFKTNCQPTNECYWQHVNQITVDQMIEEGVKALTDSSDAEEAWQTILSDYTSGDIVGIKINGNDFEPFYHSELNYLNTLPQAINAIINGVKSRGVPESDIWVIEPTGSGGRQFYSYYYDIIHGLYPQVKLLDRYNISFSNKPELLVNTPCGNVYITDQMADIDHLIIVPIMKAITPNWGLTGAIKMMQGNVQSQSNLHGCLIYTTADNPDVLIYKNPHILNKTRLIVSDGLFGAWTGVHFGEGGYGGTDYLNGPINDTPRRWITFNNGAPNSLFFAIDPVAIDSVMNDYIIQERNEQNKTGSQRLAKFDEPLIQAGVAGGLGIYEHIPYSQINYLEIDSDNGGSPPLVNTCNDSDGGIYPKVKGNVTGYENGLPYIYYDGCTYGSTVFQRPIYEYYCDGTTPKNRRIDCASYGTCWFCNTEYGAGGTSIGSSCIYVPNCGGVGGGGGGCSPKECPKMMWGVLPYLLDGMFPVVIFAIISIVEIIVVALIIKKLHSSKKKR